MTGSLGARRSWVLLGALATAVPAMAGTPASPSQCWRDYPIPTRAADYRQALAGQTVLPERIVWMGRPLRPGMSLRQLQAVLGDPGGAAPQWQSRDADQQCEHLLDLLREQPDSMHLYKLGELKLRKMAGQFAMAEWELPDAGRLRAHLHRAPGAAAETVYLLQLRMMPIDAARIQPLGAERLLRTGAARIEWDLRTNQIAISRPGPAPAPHQ